MSKRGRPKKQAGRLAVWRSKYLIPKCLFDSAFGSMVFRNGEWCSLTPSGLKKTWADNCQVCGRDLEIGEACSCKPPFVFMLSAELALVLYDSDYSPAYANAILEKFERNRSVEAVAADWGLNPGTLAQFCFRVRRKLDALLME